MTLKSQFSKMYTLQVESEHFGLSLLSWFPHVWIKRCTHPQSLTRILSLIIYSAHTHRHTPTLRCIIRPCYPSFAYYYRSATIGNESPVHMIKSTGIAMPLIVMQRDILTHSGVPAQHQYKQQQYALKNAACGSRSSNAIYVQSNPIG